jgi:SAM-dependent methyltransferase
MTASLPYPFDPVLTRIFDGKEVLEIGPGNGRQYDRLKGVVQSYCICDISPNALAEPAFADLDGKFLLTDWDQNLPKLFDVVHFWYVLHHVRHDEMQSFFRFVAKNLKPGGLVAFNSPELMNVQGPVGGDGLIHTTYSDPAIVREASAPLEVLVELPVGMKSTGYVFLLRKPL